MVRAAVRKSTGPPLECSRGMEYDWFILKLLRDSVLQTAGRVFHPKPGDGTAASAGPKTPELRDLLCSCRGSAFDLQRALALGIQSPDDDPRASLGELLERIPSTAGPVLNACLREQEERALTRAEEATCFALISLRARALSLSAQLRHSESTSLPEGSNQLQQILIGIATCDCLAATEQYIVAAGGLRERASPLEKITATKRE